MTRNYTSADFHNFLGRHVIGLDNIASELLSGITQPGPASFPPYNLELITDDEYRLTMAVAGYSRAELTTRIEDGHLIITGTKTPDVTAEKRTFIHKGIAERDFERRFKLMEYVEVVSASLVDGVLTVELKRELPESLKPRTVDIG